MSCCLTQWTHFTEQPLACVGCAVESRGGDRRARCAARIEDHRPAMPDTADVLLSSTTVSQNEDCRIAKRALHPDPKDVILGGIECEMGPEAAGAAKVRTACLPPEAVTEAVHSSPLRVRVMRSAGKARQYEQDRCVVRQGLLVRNTGSQHSP